jgi:hypothetical protein
VKPAWRCLAAALGVIGLWTSPAAVADSPVSDQLEVTAAPYMWFLELDGNATAKGQKADVDVGFDDIWDNLNFGAMFAGEVRKGRIGVYGNVIYADLEATNSAPAAEIKAEITTLWAGLGAYYRLGPWSLDATGSEGPQLLLDPYAGARYTYLDVELDVKNGGPTFSGDQDWVDPIVGFRSIWQLTPRWSFTTTSDIGPRRLSVFDLHQAGQPLRRRLPGALAGLHGRKRRRQVQMGRRRPRPHDWAGASLLTARAGHSAPAGHAVAALASGGKAWPATG